MFWGREKRKEVETGMLHLTVEGAEASAKVEASQAGRQPAPVEIDQDEIAQANARIAADFERQNREPEETLAAINEQLVADQEENETYFRRKLAELGGDPGIVARVSLQTPPGYEGGGAEIPEESSDFLDANPLIDGEEGNGDGE